MTMSENQPSDWSATPPSDPAVIAAIASAAAELLLVGSEESSRKFVPSQSCNWRFSGRWWNKPIAAIRDRP
ncbi:MAG: hypothetical protein HKL80_03670 [Acidimicrobiales bacterium]|nr:hypothetical protein [Acidimicrobiales bacterium]